MTCVDPACLASRFMWTPDPVYMAPELRRGRCGTCQQPVTIHHLRCRDPATDKYFHCDAACVPAALLETLGPCGFCGAPVLFPLPHAKVGGVWYHGSIGDRRSCWRRQNSRANGAGSDDEPKKEAEAE